MGESGRTTTTQNQSDPLLLSDRIEREPDQDEK
jgi:hypothetical protein